MDDWRLMGQESYLHGVTLMRRPYRRYSETWDHDHCAFCFKTFTEYTLPDALHEGYATSDEQEWICDTCFEDFRGTFEWKLSEETGRDAQTLAL